MSLRGRPILLITRMIIDRTGLHSVLLPLQIREKPLPKNTKNPLPADCLTQKRLCLSSLITISQCVKSEQLHGFISNTSC